MQNSADGSVLIRLKELIARRLCCVLANEGSVLAGTCRNGENEYVILVTYLETESKFSLLVSDKILPFLNDKGTMLEVLGRLNNDSFSGIHQIMVFPDGVIYAYKQTLCLQEELTEALFEELLEEGIQEFDLGLRLICQCFEGRMKELGQVGGSKSAIR